jgi:hypothetical protein
MSSKCFVSFSTSNISAKLNSVGVSLGSNEKEVVMSNNAFTHMEFDRLKVTTKVLNRSGNSLLEEEELHATVHGQLLWHLVGEVSKVGLDKAGLRSVYDMKASGQKLKAST